MLVNSLVEFMFGGGMNYATLIDDTLDTQFVTDS